jgi:hypothetical protein
MNLRYKLADDARPHAKTLLLATLLTVALWFIPFADILTYPFRLFVTFIHEGGHALAAVLTGNSVQSLIVSPNASGEVMATQGGLFSQLFVSSAGYLGATLYGALLLFLIRRAVAARFVLLVSAGFILTMTIGYGLWNLFTLASGVLLALGLVAAAKFLRPRAATFLMSFLAVQCVLNALFDLKTLFYLSSPFGNEVQTDAANIAAATGIPAFVWSFIWIAVALLILSLAMRTYTTMRRAADSQPDLPFEDEAEI